MIDNDGDSGQAKMPSTLNKLVESGGFWGTVGTLLGALIGGIFSFQAAAMATTAESERSRQDFFLAERVTVYSKLLGGAQAFQLSATRYNNIARSPSSDAAEAETLLEEALADYENAISAS